MDMRQILKYLADLSENNNWEWYRAYRMENDRSPLNPSFRAHISSKGKQPVPVGYYLMIKSGGQSFLRGGLSTNMFKDATTMIRDYIAEHGDEFGEIIHFPEFQKYFEVQGTSLKNVPAGYELEHPQAEYLKFKNWYLKYPVADEALNDSEIFIEETVRLFRIMKPFNDYLNKALDGFQMPAR